MSEPRIGRVLVASLHQAIADVLPMRLEFYENWLNATGLRDGTIGLAALSAVLSFLRAEGPPYQEITSKAGEYAAEWTVRGLPGMERRLIAALPSPLRLRAALRTARLLVRATYPGSRAIVRVRRASAEVDLRGSLFCEVRTASPLPLCGFYAAAIARVLHLLSVGAQSEVLSCRASGASRGCTLMVAAGRRTEPEIEVPEHAA
jgi:uncharacterized membrane protein